MSMEVLEAIEELKEINKSIKSIEGVVFNLDNLKSIDYEGLLESCYVLYGYKVDQERKIKRLRKKYADDRRCFYLEVVFHDNDFTGLIEEALRWTYEYIKRSGDVTESYQDRDKEAPVHRIFKKLNKRGILEYIIIRQSVLSYLSNDLEHEVMFFDKSLKPIDRDDTWRREQYFHGMELKFHYGNKFAKEWRNGEHVYLNLDTGETKAF